MSKPIEIQTDEQSFDEAVAEARKDAVCIFDSGKAASQELLEKILYSSTLIVLLLRYVAIIQQKNSGCGIEVFDRMASALINEFIEAKKDVIKEINNGKERLQ